MADISLNPVATRVDDNRQDLKFQAVATAVAVPVMSKPVKSFGRCGELYQIITQLKAAKEGFDPNLREKVFCPTNFYYRTAEFQRFRADYIKLDKLESTYQNNCSQHNECIQMRRDIPDAEEFIGFAAGPTVLLGLGTIGLIVVGEKEGWCQMNFVSLGVTSILTLTFAGFMRYGMVTRSKMIEKYDRLCTSQPEPIQVVEPKAIEYSQRVVFLPETLNPTAAAAGAEGVHGSPTYDQIAKALVKPVLMSAALVYGVARMFETGDTSIVAMAR